MLSSNWLAGPYSSRFDNLKKVINKSYNKARFKYGIIKTPRINSKVSIYDNFRVQGDSEISILLLLGAEEQFKKFREEDNYFRAFEPSFSWEEANDCNIPEKYLSQLVFNENTPVKLTYYDLNEPFTAEQANRIIGSVGFKSYKGAEADSSTRELEVTAFTSFMRRSAPTMLELAIKHYLKLEGGPHKDLHGEYEKVVLHAEVIKEHNLVQYYVNACSFEQADKPEVLIPIVSAANSGIFEDNLEAYQDFHICSLYRAIKVN